MTDTSLKNIETVQNQIKNVLENKEEFLTQERFDIVKDSYITKLEESEILNYSNVGRYMDEPEWRIESIINTISLQDVYNVVDEYLNWDNMYKSIDKTEFE